MNTIADQPDITDYRTRAIVTGARFSSSNRYSGTVTASRKDIERVTANPVLFDD